MEPAPLVDGVIMEQAGSSREKVSLILLGSFFYAPGTEVFACNLVSTAPRERGEGEGPPNAFHPR